MYAIPHEEIYGYMHHGSLPNRSYRPENSMIRYMSDSLRKYLGTRILVGDDEIWAICNYLHGHNTLHKSGLRWVR